MNPEDVDVVYSGINAIDIAAGDDVYVFMTPFGTVVPMFAAARGRPVLAYRWSTLQHAQPTLRVRDLEGLYTDLTDVPDYMFASRVVAESDWIGDAADRIHMAYGPGLEALQALAQIDGAQGLEALMQSFLSGTPRHDLLTSWSLDAGTVASYIDVEDDDGTADVQEALVAQLQKSAREIAFSWDRLVKYAASRAGELPGWSFEDLPAESARSVGTPQPWRTWSLGPRQFWADISNSSPELLYPEPLPICRAAAVYEPAVGKWFALHPDICAEGEAALELGGWSLATPHR